jgi:hypothetical protein
MPQEDLVRPRLVGPSVFALLSVAALSVSAAESARSFGKPLAGRAPVALADVLAKPQDGQAVCVEGTVAAVCQAKGCWLELKQADQTVHVTFDGYSFFVPKDSSGRAVKLEGRVAVKTPSADEVEHLRKEGASKAAAAQVSIVATGVELR